MSETRSVVIIGGGPSAWSAAIYAARADLKPVVFTGSTPGGQLMLTTEVENFPGFNEGVDGPVLMQQMREQAERFGAEVIDDVVTQVAATEELAEDKPVWLVKTAAGEYKTMTVIVATGAQARWLGVPGEAELRGRGVSACAVCDAAFFRGKETIVVGGGDSAMEDALALSRFCSKVTIVHRRDSFRASKAMIEKVSKAENISVMWNGAVEKVLGEQFVTGVEIKNVISGEVEVKKVDGVFAAIGHTPATEFLKGVVELTEQGYVKTGLIYQGVSALGGNTSGNELWKSGFPSMTSQKGIFAGGDCVDFRYRQASTAAAFGVMTALDAERYLEMG